jgi:hypothetical protein
MLYGVPRSLRLPASPPRHDALDMETVARRLVERMQSPLTST